MLFRGGLYRSNLYRGLTASVTVVYAVPFGDSLLIVPDGDILLTTPQGNIL